MAEASKNPMTKKERIWQMLERGEYSAQEIAKTIDTPIENVYKETSRFRKIRGKFTIERSRQTGVTTSPSGRREVAKTEKVRLQVENNDLIEARSLTSEDLKVLYADLELGLRTPQIVQNRGLHPEAVEIEERRYLRIYNQDRTNLINRILEQIGNDDSVPTYKIREKYAQTGSLDNTDIAALLLVNSSRQQQLGVTELLTAISNPSSNVPGFTRPVCCVCQKPIPDIIVRKGSHAEREVSFWTLSCTQHTIRN